MEKKVHERVGSVMMSHIISEYQAKSGFDFGSTLKLVKKELLFRVFS